MPSNDAKCPKCKSDLKPGRAAGTSYCPNGSTWLDNGFARYISHECAAAELASLKQSLADEKQKLEAVEKALNRCQDERAGDFAKWFKIMSYGGLTEYQPECAIIVDEWLRELMQLRHLAYAVKEFLHPQEWKFHVPPYCPGLSAKLLDVEYAANRTLGEDWREKHERHVALLAQPQGGSDGQ